MRIYDLEEGDDNAVAATSKGIYEQLKRNSVVRSGEKLDAKTGEITTFTQSQTKVDPIEGASALRAFLKKS